MILSSLPTVEEPESAQAIFPLGAGLNWHLGDDGTLSIEKSGLRLSDAFPAWDDAPLRAVSISVKRREGAACATYCCVDGKLVFDIEETVEGLVLRARLLGFARAPRRLLVLGPAYVEGAVNWMQNGCLNDLPKPGDPAVLDDYGLVNAVISADGGTLAFGTHEHRRFRVAGRVIGRDALRDGLHVSLGYHLECLTIPAEGLDLPPLFISWGPRPYPTLQAFARAIAAEMGVRHRFAGGTHWCSWYYHYFNFCRADLEALLEGLKSHPSPDLRAIQIDAGYFTAPGDWLSANERWPGGLEPAFARIAEEGYLPGIWIAPYMAGNRSRLIAEHPDWILRRHDGTPVLGITSHGESKVWGYPDEEWYVLDSSHPGVTDYIVHCLRTLRAWGARYFKTDFLFWAFFEPGDDQVRRHSPGLTSLERMRNLFTAMREAMGEDAFWLGCLAPFPPMIGFADAVRTGGDNASVWPLDASLGGHSASHLIRSSWAVQFINGILWQNDADSLILRDFHTELSNQETHTLAYWVAALGGAVNTSDPLHLCSEERRRLWRFCAQGPIAGPAELPYWGLPGQDLPLIVRPYPELGAWAVLVANISGEARQQSFAWPATIGMAGPVSIAAWGLNGIGGFATSSELVVRLPAHGHQLWWVSASGLPPPDGLTLGGALCTQVL